MALSSSSADSELEIRQLRSELREARGTIAALAAERDAMRRQIEVLTMQVFRLRQSGGPQPSGVAPTVAVIDAVTGELLQH